MKAISSAWFIAWVAIGVSSCTVPKIDKPEEKKEGSKEKLEAPKLVGRIASIPHDRRFVLIQSYEKWAVETGTILTTRGPDNRSANLLATGESLSEFAAADLQSGLVEVGDAVYLRPIPKPPASSTTPDVPAPQPSVTSGNFQKNN